MACGGDERTTALAIDPCWYALGNAVGALGWHPLFARKQIATRYRQQSTCQTTTVTFENRQMAARAVVVDANRHKKPKMNRIKVSDFFTVGKLNFGLKAFVRAGEWFVRRFF